MKRNRIPYGKRVAILRANIADDITFEISYDKKNKKSFYYAHSKSSHIEKVRKEYKSKIISIYDYFGSLDIKVFAEIDEIGNVYFYDVFINDNFLDYDLMKEIFKEHDMPMQACLYEGKLTKKIVDLYIGNYIRTIPEEHPRIFFNI